jgi:hypothetical protein
MSLESYFEEARCTLTAFLISILQGPQHWYSPLLSEEHPSSFCSLFGLTTDELNILLESCRFMTKRGKQKKPRFESLAFNNFLSMTAGLQSIECASSKPRILITRNIYWAYLIGMAGRDSFALNFSDQLTAGILPPPPVDESNENRVALKELAKKLLLLCDSASLNATERQEFAASHSNSTMSAAAALR